MENISSHGRGGAGNMRNDPEELYTDGEIVREGNQGDQGAGAYSTGRGGAGNIGSPGITPASKPRDQDYIPEAALIRGDDDGKAYHVGRGGAGNEYPVRHNAEHKDHNAEHKDHNAEHGGLTDKLKAKILGK